MEKTKNQDRCDYETLEVKGSKVKKYVFFVILQFFYFTIEGTDREMKRLIQGPGSLMAKPEAESMSPNSQLCVHTTVPHSSPWHVSSASSVLLSFS